MFWVFEMSSLLLLIDSAECVELNKKKKWKKKEKIEVHGDIENKPQEKREEEGEEAVDDRV